jgi:hypothetical protein
MHGDRPAKIERCCSFPNIYEEEKTTVYITPTVKCQTEQLKIILNFV